MRLVPSPPPTRRFSRRLLSIVAALLVLAAPAAVAMRPVPLDWKHTVGDPSVVKTTTDYVVIATGAKVDRALSKDGKVWKWKSSALPKLPTWAKPNGGDIWAADMEKVGSKYVLYFAAPVKGRTGSSRCIGAATSNSATGTFVPVPGPPLVCPSWFTASPAQDRVIDQSVIDAYPSASAAAQQQRKAARTQCNLASASAVAVASSNAAAASAWAEAHPSSTPTPTDSPSGTPTGTPTGTVSPTVLPTGASTPPSPTDMPSFGPTVPVIPPCTLPPLAPKPATPNNVIGAIDPSFFADANGAPYLLYKTDGRPSSIRILPLTADGLHPLAGAYSQELVNNAGVLENPVMVYRSGKYYLFNSYGDYARCSYSTVWRSSTSLTNWSGSTSHVLLNRAKTKGLCGPGGADVLTQPGKTLMYFEAWTCRRTWQPCGKGFWSYSSAWQRKHPVRALYAVRLGFNSDGPFVRRFIRGSKH